MNIILEWVAKICEEYLMPFLAAFSDSPLIAKIMVLVLVIGSASTAAIKFPSPKKWLSIPIGIGVTILGFFVIAITSYQPSSSSEDTGNLQVTFQIMQIWTDDEEKGELCTASPTEELNIENIGLISKTDNTIYDYSDFQNNTLQFNQLPAGSYDLSVKFADYCQQDQKLVLSKNNLKDGQWEPQTILLKSQNSSENVSLMVAIQDESNESFKNANITLQPEGSTDKVIIPLGNKGNSSKKISVADNVSIRAEVNYGEEKQTQSFTICGNQKLITEKTSDDSLSYPEDIPTEDYEEDNYVFIEDQKLYLRFYKPEFVEEDTWRLECDEKEAERKTEILQNNPRKLLAKQEAAVLDWESFEVSNYTEGMLTTENPQQYYPVDLEDNSYWIEFDHAYPYSYDMSSWHITVIDDSYNIWLDFNVSVDSEKVISDVVDLETGQYYICIESYDGYGVLDINYALCLKKLNSAPTFEDAGNFEDEQDYTGTFIYGCISRSDDIDHYSFQLETDAVIAFKFEHTFLSNNEPIWKVMLKDKSDNIIGKISVTGNESNVSVKSLAHR